MPIDKAKGLFAPTLYFCRELKATTEIVVKETAEKPKAAVKANVTKPKRFPAIKIAITLAANSVMKTVNARKSAAFKHRLKMSL